MYHGYDENYDEKSNHCSQSDKAAFPVIHIFTWEEEEKQNIFMSKLNKSLFKPRTLSFCNASFRN